VAVWEGSEPSSEAQPPVPPLSHSSAWNSRERIPSHNSQRPLPARKLPFSGLLTLTPGLSPDTFSSPPGIFPAFSIPFPTKRHLEQTEMVDGGGGLNFPKRCQFYSLVSSRLRRGQENGLLVGKTFKNVKKEWGGSKTPHGSWKKIRIRVSRRTLSSHWRLLLILLRRDFGKSPNTGWGCKQFPTSPFDPIRFSRVSNQNHSCTGDSPFEFIKCKFYIISWNTLQFLPKNRILGM